MTKQKNAAILLSGGVGCRIGGDVPKQYLRIGPYRIITYTLQKLLKIPSICTIVIVADAAWKKEILSDLEIALPPQEKAQMQRIRFTLPGQNRQLSIYHGLLELKDLLAEDAAVLVHDAVRPFASEQLLAACLQICDHADGAMPVLSMKDTVYYSADGQQVSELLEREKIYAGQAPEAFRFGPYFRANEALLPDRILSIHGSTEPAILAGMQIRMIPGEESNFKITTPEDLSRCQSLMA